MGLFDYLPPNQVGRKYKPQPATPEEAMRRWPRITSHVIAESLGYASPTVAACILLDGMNRKENWCEWIDSCYNRNALQAVKDSIRKRKHHRGYMAEYERAYSLVRRALDTGEEPMLASWF